MLKSSTTTRVPRIPYPHPGETIREDFLKPLGLSTRQLASRLDFSAQGLEEIVKGRSGITADLALRLAGYFNTTPQFWLNLQNGYDLAVAMKSSPRFEVKPAAGGQYMFSLKAGSGKVILSGGRYRVKSQCLSTIAAIREHLDDDRFWVRHSGRTHYFTLTAANRQVIGRSEKFRSAAALEKAIDSARREARIAPVV